MFSGSTAFSQVAPSTLFYFPQVAAGESGGFRYISMYILSNPGATALQARLEFFGSNGNPLSLLLSDGITEQVISVSSVADVNILPNETRIIIVGLDGPLTTGWTRISSSTPFWAASLFELHVTGGPESSVGVPPSAPLQHVMIAAVRNIGEGLNVGIAMANLSDAPAQITAALFNSSGLPGPQVTFTLPARGHRALFVSELFPTLAPVFFGKVTFSSSTPVIAMNLLFDETRMTSIPAFRP
jgi:hypothetical protein